MSLLAAPVRTMPANAEAVRFDGSSRQAAEILNWVKSDGIAANGHLQHGMGDQQGSLFIHCGGREVLRLDAGSSLIRFGRGDFAVYGAADFACRFEVVPE